jgi:hypothetical protein
MTGFIRRPMAVPAVSVVMLELAVLKAALAVVGFGRTWRWIQANARRTPARFDADATFVAASEYAVAMAAALYPGHAACLERSLTLYWHLRRAGVPVAYRMGVQMYPFLAHAWVERDGVPINDIPEHVRLFRPIEGLGA